VLGITSIPGCLCYAAPGLLCGIMAIIFGVLARKAVARGAAGGSSLRMAKAGIICGIIGIILAVVFAIVLGLVIWWAETQVSPSPVYYR